jgi:hypothetical protein
MSTLVALLVPALLIAFYLSWTASRLDRLHHRVETARFALDAQLVRRSAVALELATSRLLDPAAALLIAGAAHVAREADGDKREPAESDLSGALRAALDQPGQVEELRSDCAGKAVLAELDAAAARVVMARRFHNDAVRASRAVRRKRHVRYLRLAGNAPEPISFECDDEPPACLARSL